MASVRPRASVWMLVLFAVVTGSGFAAVSADPVAVLVQMTGAVQVQKAGAAAPGAASVGMQLAAGDRVLVPSGGKAVLLHKTGKMETATAAVTIAAPAQGGAQAGLFDRTVKTMAAVATTNAKNDPNRQGMIRPIPGTPVQVSPRNAIRVLDVRPTFVWHRVPDTKSYMIQIRRVDGACEVKDVAAQPAHCRFVRFQAGADTTWTLPATEAPLVPGATYEWAVGGGRPSQPQRFRVAGAAEFAALAEAFEAVAAAGIDPLTDGLFVVALAYRDAGLFYEADRVLNRLAASGVATGSAYHNLRGEVYDALGRVEEGMKEFAKAAAAEQPSSN